MPTAEVSARLTVADVLALPEVQAGQPVVLAGEAGLLRPVRWVHVLELSKVEGLLRGGELVLTTGVALPTSNDELRRYVAAVDRARASGLLLQLGERWVNPPPALLAAADRVGLPVIGLPVEVPFVAITESVHASIVSSSYAELQASERLYELFARRGIDGSSPQQVAEDAAALAGAPVVLESPGHRVLAAALAGREAAAVLANWESRSRRTAPSSVEASVGPEGWVVRPVAVREQVFGRLVLLPGGGAQPRRLQVLAVERAAEAIAVARLVRGDGPHLERTAQAQLLRDLVERRYRSDAEG
ncbi:MAG: PucR family transcriptional regulator ligand-binding domain-containing protein, partial [Actinomycetota bacterium]|nr:PucR family transcriptional regulator ligand-binding domain-containing protein [Actinomycetota bacterium]